MTTDAPAITIPSPRMDPEAKAEWIEALLSVDEDGRPVYEQTRGTLKRIIASETEDGNGAPPGLCCLGVLCDVRFRKGEGSWKTQGRDVMAYIDGEAADQSYLTAYPPNVWGVSVLPESLRDRLGLEDTNPRILLADDELKALGVEPYGIDLETDDDGHPIEGGRRQVNLATLNDWLVPFPKIAELIEKHL